MKTIQMTLDEALLKQVDRRIKELKTTRSAFIRHSLRYYLRQSRIKDLEARHQEGYLKHPTGKNEFEPLENMQAWE
jgi:metal-responsive CopG/Arc/MetJ family transcriptional regulator